MYEQAQASPEFQALRRRLRRFVFPMSALFLGWYLAYVLLASYARPFMAIKLVGNINVGLALGLLQFVSTFVITTLYVRFARRDDRPGRRRDPSSDGAPVNAVGNVYVNVAIFLAFVVVTLVVVYRTARGNRTASDYYAAGRAFTGAQNGVAIAGDYLSAASFLGIAGAIALNGYDGFLYSIGFLVAWLVALLLVAELLRNTGKFTIGDVLAFRMRQRPVRAAAAVSTLMVSLFYLLAQMAGAGGLVALLLQIPADDKIGQGVVIAVVGALMIVYVLVGGMKGTTYVQIIKAVLLLLAAGVLTTWVLGYVGFDLSGLLGQAAAASPKGEQVLAPGLQYLNPARLRVARARPGARHGGPAAHPHAVLHGADRHRGASFGGVGDLADRPVLPVHAGAGLRRGRAAAARHDHVGQPEQRRPAAGLRARR